MMKFILFLSASLFLLTLVTTQAQSQVRYANYDELSERYCENEKCEYQLFGTLNRDSKSCLIHPADVAKLPTLWKAEGVRSEEVQGSIAYFGIFRGRYHYEAELINPKTLLITAKIYFSNHRAMDNYLNSMEYKLKQAAEKLSIKGKDMGLDYDVKFRFEITYNKREASVTPRLINRDTRGPYFSRWSTKWEQSVITHEIGHVLGLDDEYSETYHTRYCDRNSFMCTPLGRPLNYHYYVILRRLLCNI